MHLNLRSVKIGASELREIKNALNEISSARAVCTVAGEDLIIKIKKD